MGECPFCNKNLIPIYERRDPTLLINYACFGCGIKYDPSITKIYSNGRIGWSSILRKILDENPSQDSESLFHNAMEEVKKYGVTNLRHTQRTYLSKLTKRLGKREEF